MLELKQGGSRASFPIKALEEDLSPGLFQLLEAVCFHWLVAAASMFNASRTLVSTLAAWVIQDNLLVSTALN